MSVLIAVIQTEAWLFLAAVTLVVLHRLISGEIDIGEAQLNRLQWLAATLGFAAYYLSLVVSQLSDAELPDPGSGVAIAFGGSSLLYLVNKLIGLWPNIYRSDRAT